MSLIKKNSVLNYASLLSPVIYHQDRLISLDELLKTVDYLQTRVPEFQYCLNLYEERYYFLLGFLLTLKQQKISLLPSTITLHVLEQLKNNYDDILVLCDEDEIAQGIHSAEFLKFDLKAFVKDFTSEQHQLQGSVAQKSNTQDQLLDKSPRPINFPAVVLQTFSPANKTVGFLFAQGCFMFDESISFPEIDLQKEVAIIFTSGSTGQPKPYKKQWGDLVFAAAHLAENFLSDSDSNSADKSAKKKITALLATVPAQHMYGLEFSIMMALQNGLLIHSARPFFPQDITHCLEAFDQSIETILVTTPLHVKACLKTAITLPGVKKIISATAVLEKELAAQCEKHYGVPVMELFGCTEVGSMAWRRTIESKPWTVLNDISLTMENSEVQINTTRSIEHFQFNDIVDLIDEHHFILKGRKEDLINQAGKRISLSYLNHHLQSYDALHDASYYQDDSVKENRLLAFVVLKDCSHEKTLLKNYQQQQTKLIRDFLKDKIESVFLPKKIYFVQKLPRNATGKLPIAKMKALFLSVNALEYQKKAASENENILEKSFIISDEHPALAGHFPANPIVPGVVILDHVIRLWQEQSQKIVKKIINAKFIIVLKQDVVCTIRYAEIKKNNNIGFLIFRNKDPEEVICKGIFSYGK